MRVELVPGRLLPDERQSEVDEHVFAVGRAPADVLRLDVAVQYVQRVQCAEAVPELPKLGSVTLSQLHCGVQRDALLHAEEGVLVQEDQIVAECLCEPWTHSQLAGDVADEVLHVYALYGVMQICRSCLEIDHFDDGVVLVVLVELPRTGTGEDLAELSPVHCLFFLELVLEQQVDHFDLQCQMPVVQLDLDGLVVSAYESQCHRARELLPPLHLPTFRQLLNQLFLRRGRDVIRKIAVVRFRILRRQRSKRIECIVFFRLLTLKMRIRR